MDIKKLTVGCKVCNCTFERGEADRYIKHCKVRKCPFQELDLKTLKSKKKDMEIKPLEKKPAAEIVVRNFYSNENTTHYASQSPMLKCLQAQYLAKSKNDEMAFDFPPPLTETIPKNAY